MGSQFGKVETYNTIPNRQSVQDVCRRWTTVECLPIHHLHPLYIPLISDGPGSIEIRVESI